jgi:hypothetical protein
VVTLRTTKFNIKKLHILPTLCVCVLYVGLSQKTQRRSPYTTTTTTTEWFLDAIANLQKTAISFVVFIYASVRPRGITRLLLGEILY